MTPTAAPVDLRRPVRGPLWVFGLIVLLYAALISWWVVFFSRQGDVLMARLKVAGSAPDEVTRQALYEATYEWSRMFMFEGGFMGLLLLASMGLVLRSIRQDVALARRQRDFVSAVTHELRSPLASIRLYLDSLLMGRAEGEKAQRYLKHARLDVDRLSRLVEEVLTTRALAEGVHEVHLEDVDLAEIASRVAARLAELHPGARLDVSTAEPAWVRADTHAVERILDNLVSNAVKYAGQEGPIRVEVVPTSGGARLAVIDRGPGLRGARPKDLTAAFFRGQNENVRTHPGVGLGLFVVRSLTEAQGGHLELLDRAGGAGLTVAVSLPHADGRPPDAAPSDARPAAPGDTHAAAPSDTPPEASA